MALSLNANWLAAMSKANPEIRFRITVHVDVGVSYTFTDGKCSSVTDPESAHTVSPVSRSLDTWTRKTQTNQVTVTLVIDGYVQKMLTTYGVEGARVVIEIGEASLAVGDFETYYTGMVAQGVLPQGKFVALKIKTFNKKLRMETIQGWGNQWSNLHPLDYIKAILDEAGMDGEWYDSTSLTPSNWPTISHWVCDREFVAGYVEGQAPLESSKVVEMIDELTELMGGQFTESETGLMEFTRFDASTAVVDNWTVDDISNFEIVSLYDNLVNQILIKSHPERKEKGEGFRKWFLREDTASQQTFATTMPIAGKVINPISRTLETKWVNGYGNLLDAMTAGSPGVGATFDLEFERVCNMAGMRWPGYPSGSRPTDAELSDSRFAYILIDDEIIECDRCTTDQFRINSDYRWEESTNGYIKYKVPNNGTYRVKSRGALGTTAASHTVDAIGYDVTIPVAMASDRLARFHNGAWELKCRTNLSKFANQLGDFVTVTVPVDLFIAKDHAGLNTAVKLEITGKSIVVAESEAYIEWNLVYASDTGAPAMTVSNTARHAQFEELVNQQTEAAQLSAVSEMHVHSGFTLSGISGFDFTLDFGRAVSGIALISVLSQDYTVLASKDTYVGIDFNTGHSFITMVGNGAAQPDLPNFGMWLWKIVSDGAGITTQTDISATQALDGNKLKALSVRSSEIAALAVIAGKIADGAIDTSARFATGVVDNAAIGNGAVSNSHVATGAAIAGSKLAAGTGPLTHLSSGGVFDDVLNITSRGLGSMTGDLDDIADGATYQKVGGVVGNKTTAASYTGGSVGVAAIGPNAVGSNELQNNAVIAGKIADGGISAAGQFASGVVDNTALGTNAVDSNELVAGSVLSGKLASNAVIAGKIADGAIDTSARFATGVVDNAAIGTNAVTTVKVADGSVGHIKQNLEDERSRSISINPVLTMFTNG